MHGLRNAVVEIASELFLTRITMRMLYLRFRLIGNPVSRLHRLVCINHILIKNSRRLKAVQMVKNGQTVHGAGIGAEIGFDSQSLFILFPLEKRSVCIIERTGNLFRLRCIFSRHLLCIDHCYSRLSFKDFLHLTGQVLCERSGVLCQKKQEVRLCSGERSSRISRTCVIKVRL